MENFCFAPEHSGANVLYILLLYLAYKNRKQTIIKILKKSLPYMVCRYPTGKLVSYSFLDKYILSAYMQWRIILCFINNIIRWLYSIQVIQWFSKEDERMHLCRLIDDNFFENISFYFIQELFIFIIGTTS